MRTLVLFMALVSLTMATELQAHWLDGNAQVEAIVLDLSVPVETYNAWFITNNINIQLLTRQPGVLKPDQNCNITFEFLGNIEEQTLFELLVAFTNAPFYRFLANVTYNPSNTSTALVTVLELPKKDTLLYIIIGTSASAVLILTGILVVFLNRHNANDYLALTDILEDNPAKLIENF
eukprot:TRINITY_DN1786_c0_g1_i1.p1 TRINITY_DN1786_c0_g1~~TRINITY_DN1786_c0_g1_i1.p1  ORF type:complete len:178 (-),score=33.04 TRINITY_DN1786_c0_g1_i1:5-538(-)